MPEVIGIFDGGSTTIHHRGRPFNVGVIIFRTSVNESAPVDFIAHCRLNYKDSIIKNLKRLEWAKPKSDDEIVKAKIEPQLIDKEKEKKAAKIARDSGYIDEEEYQKIIISHVEQKSETDIIIQI